MQKQSIAAVLACFALSAAYAAPVDPKEVRKGDVGPVTVFGETPAEAANKRVMFDWVYQVIIERDPKGAFDKYVSKDYCNHGHLATRMERDCVGYDETLRSWLERYGKPLQPGQKVEIPRMATVNGEMVTMFGDGIDIFRVHEGRITDHWDASPPAAFSSAPPPPAQRIDDPTRGK